MPPLERQITKTFLENALKGHFKTSVNVVKYVISEVTIPGQSYASNLLRVSITCSVENNKIKELSIVAKCFPTDEEMQVIVTAMKGFDQELQVYDELVPAINSLGNGQKFCPDPIYISLEPKPVILLQDLTELGYRMQKREIGLDLEHCRLVVEKLAYFHAASVAIFAKDQHVIKKYNTGLYFEHYLFPEFISLCYRSLIETCERCLDLHRYVNKLNLLKEFIARKLCAVRKPTGNFNVLNHGDLWTTNIMFSYAPDQKLKDVAFVDFQYPMFSSPAIDLHFFWATSVAPDVREKYMDNILECYYKELLCNMSKLCTEISPPTYQEFYEDFQARAIYGFAASFMALQFAKVTKSDDATIDNFRKDSGEDSFRFRCYNNENYLKELKYFLPFYDSLGVFN